jgi:hypothetical protein
MSGSEIQISQLQNIIFYVFARQKNRKEENLTQCFEGSFRMLKQFQHKFLKNPNVFKIPAFNKHEKEKQPAISFHLF